MQKVLSRNVSWSARVYGRDGVNTRVVYLNTNTNTSNSNEYENEFEYIKMVLI